MSAPQMNSAERLGQAMSHQEADRVPYILPVILQGAPELGLSIETYFSRAEHIIEGQLRLRARYRDDGLVGFMYGAQEVEAFGGEVIFRDDGPPNAGEPPLNADMISALEPPDFADCPALCRVLDVIRGLKQRVGDEVPVMGAGIAPFSLPVMQLGFEAYISLMYEQPDLLAKLLAVNEAFSVAWCNAQLAAGAGAISLADPVSSPAMVPRELHQAYGLPSIKRILARLDGAAAISFASAPCLPIIDDVISSGAAGVSASAKEDLGQMKAACAGKVTVMGNLNAIEMCGWSPEETERQVKACIAAAAPGGGFVLTDNHGEIPWQVPEQVLLAVGDAVRPGGAIPSVGWRTPMGEGLRLLVCSHYLVEARAAIRAEGLHDVHAATYNDVCTHPSSKGMPGQGLDLGAFTGGDALILGLCNQLAAGDLPPGIKAHQVKIEETCFALFAPATLVQRLMASRAHLLTPGWLSGWGHRLRGWGFDQPTAREFFHESTARLVLLDTGVLPGTEQLLEEMSNYLDLPREVIPVGLEHFRLHVRLAVAEWRKERHRAEAADQLDQHQRRLASHAMALDLLASLARTMTEQEAIQAILDLLAILLGARKVACVPLGHGQTSPAVTAGGSLLDPAETTSLVEAMDGQPGFIRTPGGFCLRVRYQDRDLALLAVEDLEFHQHREEYINLALSISNLLGLIIANARNESRRRDAELALQAKSDELARSNEDLSHFAYVVSHDLQAPLRSVSGFISLLAQRYSGELDDKAQEYIDYTVDGAARMKRLIEDLLRFSRINTHAREHAATDLSATLDDAMANLQAAIQESGARITSAPLPMVTADPSQMGQLLQNLVGNAIKFKGEAPPEVHVGATQEPGVVHITVQDNGIGFDMEMAERIFKIFQRLHTVKEYEGTGIGLPVCKRIVERHGGKIWVDSTPGQGTTFHFTLPAP